MKRIENPETDPHIDYWLIFNKDVKVIQWREDGLQKMELSQKTIRINK